MNYDHVPIPLFISCSKSADDSQTYSDLLTAFRLKDSLEKQGFKAFIYDEKFALETEQWQTNMKELIHKTVAVICLVSPNTPETDYVNRELELVEKYKRMVYPVWIAGDDWNAIVPKTLRGQRFFDVRHGQYSPTGLAELVTVLTAQYADDMPPVITGDDWPPVDPPTPSISIQMLIHNLSQFIINWRKKKEPPPLKINLSPETQTIAPYKGLEPFTQNDAQYFFGREQLIEKIIDRIVDLTEQQPQPNREAPLRFISIVGASGSGKSSLVMAGVMSSLRKRDQHWLCLTPTRPGYDPLGKLAQTLAAFQPPRNARSVDTLTKNLRDNATSLQKLTESIAKHKQRKLILYIDQFEELFVTGIDRADQELFIDRLESVARDPNGRVFVLITLRADFYAHWLDHNRLATLLEQQTITVPAMNINQLQEVIEKPAEHVGLTFEKDLVGDLLNDISRQREALPLLQFTLKKLYDRSDHRQLTTHIYKELGGVNGALDHYAEDIYQGNLPEGQSLASDSQREMAYHLFSKLIYINGSVDNATRRRATMSDFQLNDAEEYQTMQETIEVFVKARLLILDNQGPAKTTAEDVLTTSDTLGQPLYSDTTLEISHEALIREWKSLRNWIELHQADMHIQQNVDDASKKWKSAAEPKKQLYTGRELAKARSWAASNKPTAIQMHFIQESRKQQKKSRLVRALGIIGGSLAAILIIISIINASINHAVGIRYVVSNTHDQGEGSLRQQLSRVPDHGEIRFASGLQGTIMLSSNDLHFDKNVTIVGPDQQNVKISSVNESHIIINANETVMLQNLVFADSNFKSSSFITNQGNLTLSACKIQKNITNGNGGGISNEGGGILAIQNTTINDNQAHRNGGGIYTQNGTMVTINNSSITNNTSVNGGGIYSLQASVVINQSKIQYNVAQGGEGGGIDAIHSTLLFTTLDVENNSAATEGGGIAIDGSQATINTATIHQNHATTSGGGLAVMKDTENNLASHLALINTDIEPELPNPLNLHAIWSNTIGQSAKSSELKVQDIMGLRTNQGLTININDDGKNYSQGSPPPGFLPETSLPLNYLGTADLDTFCQNHQFSYGLLSDDAKAPSNDIQIKCFSNTDNVARPYTALQVCQDRYPQDKQIVTDRLADFYDQSSLQCYRNVKSLGDVANKQDLQAYCQHIDETLKDNQAHNTAYDWSCVNSAGQASISLTDACQYTYGNKQAFYQLVDYYDTNGWRCLAPN